MSLVLNRAGTETGVEINMGLATITGQQVLTVMGSTSVQDITWDSVLTEVEIALCADECLHREFVEHVKAMKPVRGYNGCRSRRLQSDRPIASRDESQSVEPRTAVFHGLCVSLADLASMASYVLTNTDIMANDCRPEFIQRLRRES